MKPEENWPDALAGAVIQTVADFLEARGLAKCESNVLDAAMAIVFAGLEIGRNNGVSRARLFEAGIRLLANRTGAEVVCAPLPTSAAASGRKEALQGAVPLAHWLAAPEAPAAARDGAP